MPCQDTIAYLHDCESVTVTLRSIAFLVRLSGAIRGPRLPVRVGQNSRAVRGLAETGSGESASMGIMRLIAILMVAAACQAQPDTVTIPPVKSSVALAGQQVAVAVWGTVTPENFAATVDLSDFQSRLTPILAAQLNRSEKCGERLSVQKASLTPSGLLTANVHYERCACAKAFGKEINKRLVGGDTVVDVPRATARVTWSTSDRGLTISG